VSMPQIQLRLATTSALASVPDDCARKHLGNTRRKALIRLAHALDERARQKHMVFAQSYPLSEMPVIRPSGAPLLRKWQDFFRVRSHSGGASIRLLRHGGLGEATGRPKKMEATCMMDHEWLYNASFSAPPSWGCLILGRPPWGFRRVGLNMS